MRFTPWRAALVAAVLASRARAQQSTPEPFVTRHATLDVAIDYAAKRLAGTMTLDMENWTTKPARRVSILLNRLMEASRVRDASGAGIPYTQDVRRFADEPRRQVTQVIVQLPRPIGPGERTSVRVDYEGYLVGLADIGWLYVRDRIDSAFTILRAEALAFPVIAGLNDAANRRGPPDDDFTYHVSVRVPSAYLVATGGAATRAPHPDGTVTWRYRSDGASPFLNIAIAPFDVLEHDGIKVFFFREDSAGARQLMTNGQMAIRTLEEWFGPRHGSVNLTITEIPDGWGSQADAIGGIILSAAAFKDIRRARELYHELTHLWNVAETGRPSPRLDEGLATFLEALLQERINGWTGRKEYEAYYFSAVKTGVATDSVLRTTPLIDYGTRRATQWSYSVGAVMFAVLYELIGELEFNRIVGGFYQSYFNGGSTRDFVAYANRTSSRNLSTFLSDWVLTTRWTSTLTGAATAQDLIKHYREERTGTVRQ